jgi:2-keto-3-deoxy-L-rhamnonate aldolase RhmA
MIGSWVTMSDPAASEALAEVGFDFIVVDMQHSALTRREMQDHVRTISSSRSAPYVRVHGNNRSDICGVRARMGWAQKTVSRK